MSKPRADLSGVKWANKYPVVRLTGIRSLFLSNAFKMLISQWFGDPHFMITCEQYGCFEYEMLMI